MPVKRGRLKPGDDIKIVKNYESLKNDLDPDDGTMDSLISAEVFDSHDRDSVINGGERTARGRSERFLNILQNAGQEAYGHFIHALNTNGNEHIAEQLEATAVTEQETDPLGWIDSLPDSVKEQRLTSPDASRLSAAFGNGWEHIFLELDLTKAKIEQGKMANPHSPSVAISSLFIQWIQKKGKQARFIVLLDTLRKVDGKCTIDWETVEKVVKGSQ